MQVRDHPALSPVDELQHLDYVLKSPSAGIRVGEQLGQEAMRVVSCRGIGVPGWELGTPLLPECGHPQPDPSLSNTEGYNSAYPHTPAYYSATALAGEVVLLLPGVDSPLVAYRLVGVAWLAAGLGLLWYALGLVGLGVWGRAGIVGLLGVSPVVVDASAFLNPDATAMMAGGVVLVALLKWEMGRWPWWSVPIGSGVAVWLKLTNVSAVGVLVVYLGIRAWQERDRQNWAKQRERLGAALGSILVSLGSLLIWQWWQGHRGLAAERDLPLFLHQRFDSFHWTSIAGMLRATLTPFRNQWIPDGLPRDLLAPLGGIADVGLLGILGVAVAVTAARSPYRALVGGVFAAMAGMGVLTLIASYLTLSRDPPVPGRYALAILPLAAAAIAPVLRRKAIARALVGALALATAGAMLSGVAVAG
ncbi:hypothetical protein [Candidatus Poriferisocius sp.]|uniref:hypothetical protein n=1 Tax=Candidatus Poriferisocius sp. TaxID=3101276 RepID=UPI003B022718